tara:strand:+ start:2471 stop:2908 length:438 start_codon:yes stop_codon:yes gene_type:complete
MALPEWIQKHLDAYLATDGSDGHMFDTTAVGGPGPIPCLLLTTTGRKSGNPSVLPLIYGESEAGPVIVASKGGAPDHPVWYLNLEANPSVEVQILGEKFSARARTVEGNERQTLWDQLAQLYPPYNDYQAKTSREIPVVVLEREG